MKDSFTDGFLFYRIASFMDFTYSATYGTRDIAFFFYQIYRFTIAPISVVISLRTPVPP